MWIFSASMRKRETDILLRGKKFELSAHTHKRIGEKNFLLTLDSIENSFEKRNSPFLTTFNT